MNTAIVSVKSAWLSKVNWIAALSAAVAALNETTDALREILPLIPVKDQHYVTVGIIVTGAIATIITRTFFTTTVTQASADKISKE